MAARTTKPARPSNITVENAQIRFRNFEGREEMYNSEGDRNFALFLEPELAEQLIRDGWKVKHLKPREEDDEPQAYLPVTVRFGDYPPKVVMISSRGRTELNEQTVMMLDKVILDNVDLVINGSPWEVNGNTGIKAYLKSIYATIQEDELDRKYANIPDAHRQGDNRYDDPSEF